MGNGHVCASYTTSGEHLSYFWYHLPHVSDEGKVSVRYKKIQERRWMKFSPDNVKQMGNGWWRAGPWSYPGDMAWENACWANGVQVFPSLIGPKKAVLAAASEAFAA